MQAGIMKKTSQLVWYALSTSKCIKSIVAVVKPHPGQDDPVTSVQRQGMQISIPVNAFRKTEKTKYDPIAK